MRARIPTPRQSEHSEQKQALHLPKPYKLRRYYLPSEVAHHNTKDDCWVSFFNQVFDLTQLLQENFTSELCDPIVLNAGTDITHWFDPLTKEPKTYIDPVKCTTQVYSPIGRYLHIPSQEPDSDSASIPFTTPWWRDTTKYMIGNLTFRTRKIRIINMLTKHDDILEVASEETINEILDRYIELNMHCASYTWKRLGRVLDMSKTLAENEIPDETDELIELGIDPSQLSLMGGTQGISAANKPQQSFNHKIIATPSTVFIGDIPKGVSYVEIFEYLKEHVGGDFEIVLKRPAYRYFYFAFCKFNDIYVARKLLKDIRYPEIRGKVCRVMPYEKDLISKKFDSKSSLFIKGFKKDWTHKDLYEFFKVFGEISSAKVSLKEDHHSRGYGFIQFQREESANKAIEQYDGKPIKEGEEILKIAKFLKGDQRVSTKNLFNNLYVKQFPKADLSSDELRDLFSVYGKISSAIIMKNADGSNKGFGFVCFADSDSAMRALTDLNGKDGLYVKKALKKEQREAEVKKQSEKFKKSMQKFNLYVKNFPLDTTDDELKEFFARFGEVNNVKIMRSQRVTKVTTNAATEGEETFKEQEQSDKYAEEGKLPESLGFGFVSYTNAESAARAKLETKTMLFKGKILFVSQFETKAVRQSHLEETRDKAQFDKYKKNLTTSTSSLNSQRVNQNLNGLGQLTLLQLIQFVLCLKNFGMDQLQAILQNPDMLQNLSKLNLSNLSMPSSGNRNHHFNSNFNRRRNFQNQRFQNQPSLNQNLSTGANHQQMNSQQPVQINQNVPQSVANTYKNYNLRGQGSYSNQPSNVPPPMPPPPVVNDQVKQQTAINQGNQFQQLNTQFVPPQPFVMPFNQMMMPQHYQQAFDQTQSNTTQINPAFMQSNPIFNWGNLSASQQLAINKVMDRYFRLTGIRSQMNGGLPNNIVFRKDVENISETAEFMSPNTDFRRKKEMLAEILIDWVICLADEKNSRKILGMIMNVQDQGFNDCISSLEFFRLKVKEGVSLINAQNASKSSSSSSSDSSQVLNGNGTQNQLQTQVSFPLQLQGQHLIQVSEYTVIQQQQQNSAFQGNSSILSSSGVADISNNTV
ncbi:cytochrome b5-like heme steroid binding domain containing protein [Stylonychia lemnae]|uniref:Cytochrome b5 domain-containing protein 1 n=1 Tax=Stylonychia lemnae TaxID=5949 RepID=A0A078BDA5_STYLE|nr:cytochrome b5-like heme steroid binding domain containing protein [Stylonychia lemnae]|eukprot:CDW91187.1 cytochrome b5-like heme steroid binding domain containing protein [Stylonychia lemnae]